MWCHGLAFGRRVDFGEFVVGMVENVCSSAVYREEKQHWTYRRLMEPSSRVVPGIQGTRTAQTASLDRANKGFTFDSISPAGFRRGSGVSPL